MATITRRNLVRLAAAVSATAAGLPYVKADARIGRAAKILARPESISIDTARTALIVVDMQNDFGAKGGMFDRAGIPISGIQKVVAPTARAIDLARRNGFPVIYLRMAYRPDLSDLGPPDSANHVRHRRLGVGERVMAPDGSESRVLIRDTWNSAILDDLKPHPEDVLLYKTRFSGFYNTDLHERLQGLGTKYLIVTGCTTSICVESTVRDAMFRDYSCILLEDCMSEPIGQDLSRSNHDASLLATEILLGWVSNSTHLQNALQT
jgi:ureidoacrylate peracid hydrolase